ncbi:MAG: hypothetical protein H0U00_05795 [Actinobacteria bacterium]|nr:hypothetical protein [Actinomycetota bacterium]
MSNMTSRSGHAGAIRPLERGDLPQAAASISGGRSSAALAAFLEETLFDHPWADPEIPSLVYEDKGEIVGTIGASTRRMRFEGRPLRVVVSAYLWSHPRVRERGIGARLLRTLFAGPQELTITDGATDTVRRMWETLGGRTVHLNCFSFVRVFRPWRLGAERVLARRLSRFGSLVGPASTPFDVITTRIARPRLAPITPEGEIEPLTPTAMVEHLTSVTASTRLHADYDSPYLEWLFARLDEIDRHRLPWLDGSECGAVWAELVRNKGRVLGWYVCQFRPGSLCRVLQIAAADRRAPEVVQHLYSRAWKRGASAVVGRLEPRLVAPLARERGFVRYAQSGRMLVHAKDADVVGAVLSGDALLTRLDGEWWVS